MKLTRRDAITLGLGATAASFLPMHGVAAADAVIDEFTSGAEYRAGNFYLNLREIPDVLGEYHLTINATGVTSLIIVATENPVPLVANFDVGTGGKSELVTRLSLLKSQSLRVVAKMTDGIFRQDSIMAVLPLQSDAS